MTPWKYPQRLSHRRAERVLAPIDYALLDPEGTLPDAAKKEFGVVAAAYSRFWCSVWTRPPKGAKWKAGPISGTLKPSPAHGP